MKQKRKAKNEEQSHSTRVFISVALALILLLALGLTLLFMNSPPTPVQKTMTSIVATNAHVSFLIAETETQAKLYTDATQTAAIQTTPTPD